MLLYAKIKDRIIFPSNLTKGRRGTMHSAAYIWAKIITYLEEHLTSITISTWFDDAELVELNDDHLIIYSPSDFRQEVILRNCKGLIEEGLLKLFQLQRKLLVWGDAEMKQRNQHTAPQSLWKINPHFCLDTFIPGTSNQLPLKTALHIAEHTGDAIYNPLYYYGPPGVGKTHLLYGIANRISQLHPELKIVYVKGDQFTNELIQSIMNSTTAAFKKKYREADVLLVDDIQFIAGKEATQEEFFHTFNELYELRKQIVLTSDRSPNDMPLLEDRLRSRFGYGVMVKIEAPDYETRQQIIRAKAQDLQLSLNEEIVDLLSSKLCDNVRQIEGSLRTIRAFHDLSGMQLTLTNIAQTVSDLQTAETSAVVTPDTVVRYVCKYFGVEESQLKGLQRSRNISEPRQIAMYLVRDMTNMGLTDMGKYFNRNHGTVHQSIKKVQELLDAKDENTAHILQDIRMNIESST